MLVVGIDHYRTSAATIASVGRDPGALLEAVLESPAVRGAVVLATCARVEVYGDAVQFHRAQRDISARLAAATGLSGDLFDAGMITTRRGPAALEHLFRVTTGLESAVVGETQITGQVREALHAARSRGATTRTLDIAFQNAVRVSRQARRHLAATSLAEAALDRATQASGRAPGIGLIIGTGSFASTCASALRARGTHTLLAHSRSGRELSGASSVSEDELVTALALADVVVAASGRGTPVLTSAVVEAASRQRSAPLVILDLAAGDVSPGATAVPDTTVIGLDDLAASASGAEAAAEVVRAETAALMPRIAGDELDDIIVALRSHVESVAEAVSTPETADAVRRLASALLHEPTQRARAAAHHGDLDRFRAAVETIFGVGSGSPA